MVTRRTQSTAKSTLRSAYVLTTTAAVLWVAAAGYGQDEVSSPCNKNNAGCQHTCRVFMSIGGSLGYKCSCNTGYQLAEDKHNCVLDDAFFMYSQDYLSGINLKGLNNVSEGYTDTKIPNLLIYRVSFCLDFDAHDNYIYFLNNIDGYSVYRMYRNGTGVENVITSDINFWGVNSFAVDWVAKNVYYIDYYRHFLSVLSTRNFTNRRVLYSSSDIRTMVIHPNKGYIFFVEIDGVSRLYMDGSNRIHLILESRQLTGLAVDFASDRLYWCDPNFNEVLNSNLDLTKMMSIKSESIQRPYLLVIYKDWMYTANEFEYKIMKLHKLTGALDKKEVLDQPVIKGESLWSLNIYSKHKQLIDNKHPCSIAANYGGCQKLCFAVPSNNSTTLSLQAVCSCPWDEWLDLDGKTCVGDSYREDISGGTSKLIQYRFVTTFSLVLVYLFNI